MEVDCQNKGKKHIIRSSQDPARASRMVDAHGTLRQLETEVLPAKKFLLNAHLGCQCMGDDASMTIHGIIISIDLFSTGSLLKYTFFPRTLVGCKTLYFT